MKKKMLTARKALSVFLAVLMMISTWAVAVPGVLAADGNKYYVKVYVNIYDGSDGYGGAYSVEESTGKPKNYSWATNDGWYGRINMTGFTVFGEKGDYDAQDVSAALLEAEKLNTYYNMSALSNDNANGDWDSKAISKAEYTFVLDSFPVEIFWMNDENNWDGGNTGFAIRKLTVATSENGTEHTMWEGLAGSDSETYNYYGSITPTGIHTCFEDYAKNYDMNDYKFYKAITSSSQRAWSDPYNYGSAGTYYLNEYANGGVSATFSEGVSSVASTVDYIDTSSTDTYYVNYTNHSKTQIAEITGTYNEGNFVSSPYGIKLNPGETRSFEINKSNYSKLAKYNNAANFTFEYTLSNVYASDEVKASLAKFIQPTYIGLWNESSYSKSGTTFSLNNIGGLQVTFQTTEGILETVSTPSGKVDHASVEYRYYIDNSVANNSWEKTGLRFYITETNGSRVHFQNKNKTAGTMRFSGPITNTSTASLKMADFAFSSVTENFVYNVSATATYDKTVTPTWTPKESDSFATFWNNNPAWVRFGGTTFEINPDAENQYATILLSDMLFNDYYNYQAKFSASIDVYAVNKAELRKYVRETLLDFAPMSLRYNTTAFETYQNKLASAMNVLADQKTTQKAVTNALAELKSAVAALQSTDNLINQVAELTHTQYVDDIASKVAASTAERYVLIALGEHTVPQKTDYIGNGEYKNATNKNADLKTNYSKADTKINILNYRYWNIDYSAIDSKIADLETAINNFDGTAYNQSFKTNLQNAKDNLEAMKATVNVINTPTAQEDVDILIINADNLIAHLSNNMRVHQWIEDDNGNYVAESDEDTHWYTCKICGYELVYEHTFAYENIDALQHKATCVTNNDTLIEGCGYNFTEDHIWVEGETVATSCTEGNINYSCICGATKTEATTVSNHSFAIADNGDGTHISKCSKCGVNEADAVAEAHTYTYVNNNDGTHTATCSVCYGTETVDHIFVNPELARPTFVDGAWVDGTYTYTCVCGGTKTEPAIRADYSKLKEVVEALKTLKDNDSLTDEAKAAIIAAIAKADNLADNLVTAEQKNIDDLVKELQKIKADADEAIKNKEIGVEKITEATSGVKVQFIDESGLGAIDSVQLGKDNGFIIRVANGNADSDITITKLNGADKNITLKSGESTDFAIDTKDLTAGIATYEITYTIDGLMNADGNPVEFTTKAYIYVKAEAYNPYHYLHEEAWQGQDMAINYYVEADYGDFSANDPDGAVKFNDNMEVNEVSSWRYDKYDYGTTCYDAACTGEAGCTKKSDAHIATYNYYVDTSLVKTWEDAGFRTRFVETAASNYDKVNLRYLRLAVNNVYLNGIADDDKTFTVTFVPSASGTANATMQFTSTGDLTIKHIEEPANDTLLFGSRKANATNNTAYANFSGTIPVGVNADGTTPAMFMFAPKLRMTGGLGADEGSYMTTHIALTSYDKAALREAVANAEQAGYNSGYFSKDAYEAYENALENAKVVLGKAETNQNEIDAATAALNAASAELKNAEAKFVLTVTHSIHENADKNSEATATELDYYLVNGEITPTLKASIIALETINKYDDEATIYVTADAEHTYNYWYIDYSGVQDAIDAAEEIIDNNSYSEEYKNQAQTAKDALEEIKNGKDATTTPESQDEVDNAIGAVSALTHTCADSDNDHKCNTCGIKLTDCVDSDKDHDCDICGTEMGAHEDVDPKDHNCDYCGGKISDCADNDKNHYCDTCNTKLSECADNNNDHNCDVCGAELSECADSDKNHYCDVCGDELSECADNNNDHNCDVCGAELSQCADSDKNHYCDVCGDELSVCADNNNDHNCDVCGATLSECADSDTDTDHNCDVCGKENVTEHNYVNPVLTRPALVDGEWVDGYYTSTCNCGETAVTGTVERADYEAYDEAKAALEALLGNDKLTQAAKNEISAVLEAKKIADNYIATEEEQAIVDAAAAALNVVLTEINAGIEDGSMVYVDLSAYNAALEIYNNKTAGVAKDADKVTAQKAIDSVAGITETSTKANGNQDKIDAATTVLKGLNEKYAKCADGNHTYEKEGSIVVTAPTCTENGYTTKTCDVCGKVTVEVDENSATDHNYDIANAKLITRPELVDGAWTDGKYEASCSNTNCDSKLVLEGVKRADYSAFEAAIAEIKAIAAYEGFTDEVKAAILAYAADLESGKYLDLDLVADYTYNDVTIEGEQDLIDAFVTELTKADGVIDTLENSKNDPANLKPDYEAWEEAETAYDALDKTNVKAEIITEANKLKEDIDKLQKTEGLTQATATQANINEKTDRLEEIVAGIKDGSLKDPDYSNVEDKLAEANNAEGLNKDTQDKIDAIEKALEDIKGKKEPEANAKDDQDAVDALEDQLDEILKDIANGKATAPDYTEWDTAEDAYDDLNKTNVKSDILDEVTELKNVIDTLKEDAAANAAEDQDTIDDATDRLNDIIAGITDGTLVKPDYTNYNAAVNAYEDLKDNMTAEDKATVEAIKGEIAKIPADGSKKDYQTQIDKAAVDIAAINAKYGECAEGNHKDGDNNHKCDVCNTKLSECADNNNDHNCDYCGGKISECADGNNDHKCDVCGDELSECADGNYDHKCDVCGDELSQCADSDKNHYCDTCNAKLSECADNDKNHNCDVCGDELSECADNDKNHKCDVCGDELSECADGNNDHNCDVCGTKVSDCADNNNDHNCDVCGTKLSNCSDVTTDNDHNCDICGAENVTEHNYVNPVLTQRPTQNEDKTWNSGTYTSTCNCGATKTSEAKRANYEAYDKAVADLNALLGNDKLTQAAKAEIENVLDTNEIDGNLVATEKEQKIVDDAAAALQTVLDKLTDNEGKLKDEYQKPSFEEYDDAHDEYEDLVKQYGDKIKDSVAEDVADLDEIVDGVRTDDTATKADDQDTIDNAKADLEAIIAGIKDGSLRDPDYKDVEDKLAEANNAEGLNKDTQDKIDAIEKALEDIKGKTEPEANAKDDQDDVDALEKQLDEILKDIADGKVTAPDYSEWNAAETTYDKFTAEQLKNVDEDILDEVTELKNTINALKNDPTANAAEDQDTINDATDRLNAIIEGIKDGSLLIKEADYTRVDQLLDEAKDKAEENKNDLIDGIKEEIQTIENTINTLKENGNTDQNVVTNLENRLEAIINGIESGNLLKPNYEAWEVAEKAYDDLTDEQLTNINADIIDEAEALKATIADKQEDKTLTQATATQKDINDATARLEAIVEGIINGTYKDPADFTDAYIELENAKEIAENKDVVDGVKENIQEIEDKLNELKNDPTINADDQDEIDALEKELEDIISGITNGTLVKPDYEAWEEAEAAYEALDKTNVKADIITEANGLKDKIADKQSDDTLTQATATQAEINNATERLNDIISGINDGSLKNPADFTEVDKDLADAKDKISANDVLDNVVADVQRIEDKLNELRNDPTTNADKQGEIDALEKELEDIIAGIIDNSFVKVDYTGYNNAVNAYEALDKVMTDADKAAVEAIKAEIAKIPADGSKKDYQAQVDKAAADIVAINGKYSGCAKGEHTYADTTIAPDCTNKGYDVHVCKVCGHTYNDNYVDALGHNKVVIPAKDATCAAAGNTEGVKCSRCDEIIIAVTVIPALPHTDADEDGTCDICGATGLYDGCACLCHNNHWFWRIVYMIIRIIWKVFKIHPTCGCGRVHY